METDVWLFVLRLIEYALMCRDKYITQICIYSDVLFVDLFKGENAQKNKIKKISLLVEKSNRLYSDCIHIML